MWRLMAPVLALLLLGASFLRAGDLPMVAGCAALAALMAVPRPWAAWTVQLVLALAALRWLWLAWMIASARAAMAAPYGRLILILGGVALFTLLAALVFRSARLRRYYRLDPPATAGGSSPE
jgi:hypothetical protein